MERNQPAISVTEGSSLSLTLEAIEAFGATQTELQILPAAVIDSIDSETLLDGNSVTTSKSSFNIMRMLVFILSSNIVDYNLNAASDFQISQNGNIQSVTFTAISTVADNIVEGNEQVVVRARSQQNVYEITGTNGLVAVNIIDQNCELLWSCFLPYT